MSDMIVGAVVGLSPDALRPWAATARRYHPGRIVLMAEAPEMYEGLASTYGIELRTAWLHREKRNPRGEECFKHRWTALWELLSRETRPGTRVIFADVRDTIFQRDPFGPSWPGGLIAGSEGLAFKYEQWNREIVERHFGAHMSYLAPLPVLCAGNIAGTVYYLQTFAEEMARTLSGRSGIADQAAFNIVLRGPQWENHVTVTGDAQAWVLHCAQLVEGSTVSKSGPRSEALPTLLGNIVCNSMGKIYAMVHQWPYVPKLNVLFKGIA